MVLLVVALLALCAVSGVAGAVAVRRIGRRADADAPPGDEVGLVRVRALVGTGHEQLLIGLARELHLPNRAEDVPYGGLYLDSNPPLGLVVRTSSVLGRGLVAPLSVRAGHGATELTYGIVRLPDDETLHATVLDFEVQLISALRRLSPSATIRLAGTALRDLDRAMWRESAAEQRAPRR